VLGGGWFALRSIRMARLIEDTPRSRVRSAAQGYVELSGRAICLPGTENLAPLTRRPCVWWRYRVQQRTESRSGNRRREGWRTINQGRSDVPFMIDDGTGRCVVQPLGAEVMTGESTTWYGSTPWPKGPPGSDPGLLMSREYRYYEERIYDDDGIYVLGGFRTTAGEPGLSRDEQFRALLSDWKQDTEALTKRFDADRDGKVSLGEWERARAEAQRTVDERDLERPAVDPVHTVARPDNDQVFLIASFPEGELASRFRKRALFAFAGFVAATIALGWLLQHAFDAA
jgi:E3 ubiquitin ligase